MNDVMKVNGPILIASTPRAACSHSGRRLMAFDIDVKGHHASYVRNFAQAWVQADAPGGLDLVVSPRFVKLHGNVVRFIAGLSEGDVRLFAIDPVDFVSMGRILKLRYFRAWALFCKYARQLRPDHALLMYFDFFQLPILLGERCSVPFSGIYFRPTFHYHRFNGFRRTPGEQFKAGRKWLLLKLVLHLRSLDTLFCLDEYAVEYIKHRLGAQVNVRRIADSFSQFPASPTRVARLRKELGIETGRVIFCLLGSLDGRKGPAELLDALRYVADDNAKKIGVVLAGPLKASEERKVMRLITEVQAGTPIQVVLKNEYIREEEVQHYYDMSDVILTTYQYHMGSSSALIRAAYAQKPVLSSDYGYMGESVKRRRLGKTIDTTNPVALARGVEAMCGADAGSFLDINSAHRFADQNSPDHLVRVLVQTLFAKK